jgi:beta-lactamase superfamily II metal-dependent hydrolase
MNLDISALDIILLTHSHSDHTADVLRLTKTALAPPQKIFSRNLPIDPAAGSSGYRSNLGR